MECIWDGCTKPKKRKTGHCDTHYRLFIGKECSIDSCDGSAVGRGWCGKHWQRWRKHGDPLFTERVRVQVGDAKVNPHGYVLEYQPEHPASRASDGWIMQHRLVMANHLGRPLEEYENVHHKNGVRDDNDIQNLELWVVRQPYGQRVEDLLAYADWIISEYRR